MKLNKKLFITLTAAFLITALPAHAAIIPACALGTSTPPLSCILELAVSVSNFILSITGSLALLFFVYGGFMLLTSRGASAQVEKGRTILTEAAIGIIIIFGAYIGINFLVKTIGGQFTTEFKVEQPATSGPSTKTQTAPVAQKCKCWCSAGGNIMPSPIGEYSSVAECKNSCGTNYDFVGCDFPGQTKSVCNPCVCTTNLGGITKDINKGAATSAACKEMCTGSPKCN